MRYAILALALVGCGSSPSNDIDAEPRDLKVRWSDGTSTAISLYTEADELRLIYGSPGDTIRGDVTFEKPYRFEDAPVSSEPVPGDLGQ